MAPASRGGFRHPRARPRGSPSSSGRPRGPGPAPATTRAEIQAAGGSVASIPRAPSTPAAAPASASAWPSPARKPVAVPPRPWHALRGPTERRVPSLCSPECSRGQFSTEENKDRTPAVSTVHSRFRNVTRHTRPCPGRGRPARPHLTSAGGRETHAEAAPAHQGARRRRRRLEVRRCREAFRTEDARDPFCAVPPRTGARLSALTKDGLRASPVLPPDGPRPRKVFSFSSPSALFQPGAGCDCWSSGSHPGP